MRLLLAGGGTGGHIVPNIALIQDLRSRYKDGEIELLYVGGRKGMERKMIEETGVRFKGIFCGKIRRYFSWSNFADMLKVPVGILQSFFIILSFRPTVIFCKGGYVSFPVAAAGFLARKPVVLHESDVVPGLANRLSASFAKKICISYEESKNYFKGDKTVLTGNPVRREITGGSAEKGRELTGFNDAMPVLLFMGGSQGAGFINDLLWDNLGKILERYQVIHICGEGNIKTAEEIETLLGPEMKHYSARYKAYAFVNKELKDLYAITDLAVSRAGAMSLAELEALAKPAVLIPLGTEVSRGDQIDNAKAFCKKNRAVVIEEKDFKFGDFEKDVENLINGRGMVQENKKENNTATEKIISLLESL